MKFSYLRHHILFLFKSAEDLPFAFQSNSFGETYLFAFLLRKLLPLIPVQ